MLPVHLLISDVEPSVADVNTVLYKHIARWHGTLEFATFSSNDVADTRICHRGDSFILGS
jgi:hypothetical protein